MQEYENNAIADKASILNNFIPDKAAFKSYLDENGGISVFRDGMRILDYGEPDNDWLGLDLKRVNAPTKNLSINIILAILSKESSLQS